MKKLTLISILLVVLTFTYSCKKDDSGSSNASFSAKVESTLYTGATMVAVHATGGNTTQIIASGTMPSEQIGLYYKGSGTGTFAFDDLGYNSGIVNVGNYSFSSMFKDVPVGQIVITKYDVDNKLISGTFSFEGEDGSGNTYHVTEGKFENVSLTVM